MSGFLHRAEEDSGSIFAPRRSQKTHSRHVIEAFPAEAGVPAGTPALAGRILQNQIPISRECARSHTTALFAFFVLVSSMFFQITILAAEEEAELLRPPRGELRPGFWSQYGWWVVIAVAICSAALFVWMKLLRRAKPVIVTPPEVMARSALEGLRGRTEDAALVAEVSRVFRRYVVFAFNLPPDELTTGEIQLALKADSQASPDLISAIHDFLRRCDEWKFARVPTAAPAGVVQRASELLEKTEAHRAQVKPPPIPKT